jgi:hypothetical protein
MTAPLPVPLPDQVKRWLAAGAAVDLVVIDHERQVLRARVTVERDGDDLLMAVPEGGPVHHALIYDPQATVEIRPAPAAGEVPGRDAAAGAQLHGEVEMTTAGAADLRRRTGAPGDAGETADAWLVVRVVPTAVDLRG